MTGVPHISFVGANGGVGRTTLVARFARELSAMGRVPMAFDLDPQNSLGLHLGMAPGEPQGISVSGLDRSGVANLLRRHEASVPYLPFGSNSEQALRTLEYQISREPSWLLGRVADLIPNRCDEVLIDTPATLSPWLRAGIKIADLVVVVVRPDAACFAKLPHQESVFRDLMGADWSARTRYLINRMDESRTLDRDVYAAFTKALGSRLLDGVVPECASIGESLALGRDEPRPSSPVPKCVRALVEQVLAVAGELPTRQAQETSPVSPRPQLAAVVDVLEREDSGPWQPDEGKGRYYVQR